MKIFKKFVGILIIIALFIGTVFGCYYGIEYNKLKNDSEKVTEYVVLIDELSSTIDELSSNLAVEVAQNEENKALINTLRNNVSDLQQTISDLQSVNTADIETINTLNAQIVSLNNMIITLSANIEQSSNTIVQLNAKITTLENTISYYEKLLSAYVDETKVIATFKDADGGVYNVQVINKNSSVSVNLPTDSEYVKYLGWSIDGENIIDDLSSYPLSEDTTFIPVYIRSYDVLFISDSVILNSQIIESGCCASVIESPIKSGYYFKGWTIDGNTLIDDVSQYVITENTTFIASFDSKLLEDYSWEEIAMISESGLASQYFSVGDEITITLSTEEEVTFVILGFNHDDLSDGTGKAGITFGMKNLLATTYAMNSSNTNDGGWDASLMRTNTMATLLTQLPNDLQSMIKAVDKKTNNGSTSIVTSSDKLWLLSLAEVFSKVSLEGSTDDAICYNSIATYELEGEQYEYFRNLIGDNNGCTADNVLLYKYLSNGNGSYKPYLLRSAETDLSGYFVRLGSSFYASSYPCDNSAYYPCGVCFCFCI